MIFRLLGLHSFPVQLSEVTQAKWEENYNLYCARGKCSVWGEIRVRLTVSRLATISECSPWEGVIRVICGAEGMMLTRAIDDPS